MALVLSGRWEQRYTQLYKTTVLMARATEMLHAMADTTSQHAAKAVRLTTPEPCDSLRCEETAFYDFEEHAVGSSCIAALIFNYRSDNVAALSLSVPGLPCECHLANFAET